MMPKRTNRIKAIEHERRQLDMLKWLKPNTTPEMWQPLSDLLIDLSMLALEEAANLEEGNLPHWARLNMIYQWSQDIIHYTDTPFEDE